MRGNRPQKIELKLEGSIAIFKKGEGDRNQKLENHF